MGKIIQMKPISDSVNDKLSNFLNKLCKEEIKNINKTKHKE